jgi:dihydroflavonol-4-reductase
MSEKEKITVAVVGASGHIGNNLCRALLDKGYRVRALVHLHSNALERLDVEKIRGDILDPASLIPLCTGAAAVFHAAGKTSISGDPDGSVRDVNVQGTRNVVKACLDCGVHRLVFFSSIHALKQQAELPLDESSPLIEEEGFDHDVAKSEAEREVMRGIVAGLNTVILTPTAVIGPNDFLPSLLGQGLMALYRSSLPALIAGGFDWVDVRDVAKAAVVAMEKGKAGEKYLLSGMWKTVKELALLVQEITGRPAPKFTSPHWLARMGIPFASAYSFLTMRSSPTIYTEETLQALLRCSRNISCARAKDHLGFRPRPLSETLGDTFNFYKKIGMIQES